MAGNRDRLNSILTKKVLLAALAVLPAGCQTGVIPNALSDGNGTTIRLRSVDAIVNDTTLSEAEKREGLRGLGITDERLIDALLISPPS